MQLITPLSPQALEQMEIEMHNALDDLSFADRLASIRKLDTLFKEHNHSFNKEPTLPIAVMDTKDKVDLFFSVVSHSLVFANMSEEDDSEQFSISLPHGFSKEQFETYARFLDHNQKTFPDFATWHRTKIVAERLLCDEELCKDLESKKPRCQGSLQELADILSLQNLIDTHIEGSLASECINRFINTSKATIQEICNSLYNTLPITLSLQRKLSGTDLQMLAEALPNVISLSVDITDVEVFPIVWPNTLLHLDVYSLQIHAIPEALLSRVKSLKLNMTALDFSVLNGRLNLQELYLDQLNITHVPTGCPNLEKFTARFCYGLQDISELNNHVHLKECYLEALPILSVPTGCQRLEKFTAHSCVGIQDFSGLNALPYLKICDFFETSITAAPKNCPSLEMFTAACCPDLTDFSGLNNRLNIKELYFCDVAITAIPHGCLNLKKITVIGCKQLEDFSGLNNLPHLEKGRFEPPLKVKPSGSPNLIIDSR